MDQDIFKQTFPGGYAESRPKLGAAVCGKVQVRGDGQHGVDIELVDTDEKVFHKFHLELSNLVYSRYTFVMAKLAEPWRFVSFENPPHEHEWTDHAHCEICGIRYDSLGD